MTATAERAKGAFNALLAVAEMIRELREVPSGHLYAALMTKGCSAADYEDVIGVLKRAKLIEITPAHLIRWIEPAELAVR